MYDDAEQHGDGDDGGGVVGSGTTQLLQGKEAEHYRRQAAGTGRRSRQGDRHKGRGDALPISIGLAFTAALHAAAPDKRTGLVIQLPQGTPRRADTPRATGPMTSGAAFADCPELIQQRLRGHRPADRGRCHVKSASAARRALG